MQPELADAEADESEYFCGEYSCIVRELPCPQCGSEYHRELNR
jgi:hypothetical protein